jgi:hypothetical protein
MSERLIDQAVDTFCCRLFRIDPLGVNRRLIFTVPSVDDPGYHHVAAKLIVPTDFMTTLAYMAAGDENAVSRQLLALETHIAN